MHLDTKYNKTKAHKHSVSVIIIIALSHYSSLDWWYFANAVLTPDSKKTLDIC